MYKEVLFHTKRPPLILKVNFGTKTTDVHELSEGALVSVNHSTGYVTKSSTKPATHTIATRTGGQDEQTEYAKDQVHAHRSAFSVCTDRETLSTVVTEALKTTHFAVLLVKDGDIRKPFTTEEQQAIIDILREVHAVKATKDDTDAPVSPGSHIIYVPVDQTTISPLVNPPTPTYLVPETQPIPVTITLPGVPFFQLTDDFTHANLGTKFFCMGVYGESSTDAAGKTGAIEKRTALNPYTLADTDVTLFDRVYFLGTERYAKGVQTYINQEMMTLMLSGKRAGTAMTIDKLTQMAGVSKPFGGSRRRPRRALSSRMRPIRPTRTTRPRGGRCRRGLASQTRRRGRRRRARGGGVFNTVKRAVGKVASAVTGTAAKIADKATGYMFNRALKRAVPRMLRDALKAGTEGLTGATMNVLPNLAMGATSTAFAGVNSGATLAASMASAPLSVGYSYAMRWAIRKLTAIEPEDHRCVWGNQLQDYITYKGVHVGVPQQMYYETQDFRGTHVRHLTYHLKFTVDPMIKDDDGNIVLRHQTSDYVPIVLRYEQSLPAAMAETKVSLWKQKTQALASMYDRAKRMMLGGDSNRGDASAEDQTAKTLYDATTRALPMQAEAERHTSYVRLPKKDDPTEANMHEKQQGLWIQLNRLAAQNNHLAQETMLHSLYSALHGRRLDLFFAVNFVEDAFDNDVGQVAKTILQGLSGLLAAGAAKGALKQSGVGILLNLFTAGVGANAAALAAGAHDAENLLPRLCQLVQVCLQGILSPSYFLFPLASKRKRERLRNKQHFKLTPDDKNTSVAKGAMRNIQDILLRQVMGKFPTWVVETYTDKGSGTPLTIGDLLDDKATGDNLYTGPRVLFQQFSHNWLPLCDKSNRDTPCHFLSTPNLRRHAGLSSDGPGVVLAFEAGASYRTTIRSLLKDAYLTSAGDAEAVFKQARLRAMLFGNTHYASVEYETHVADQLLRAWATGASSLPTLLFPPDSDVFKQTNRPFNAAYLKVTTAPNTLGTIIQHETVVPQAKAAGGAPLLPRFLRKTRRRGKTAETTFDEFDDDDDDETPAAPAPADTGEPSPTDQRPQVWEQKAYDTRSAREMEEQLRVQTIALLLRSMRNRFFKPERSAMHASTLNEFLSAPYSKYFPYTYVVAVVPLHTPCTFHYDPDEIHENGPYVFTSTLPFHTFFEGGLQQFMKKVYAPCILHYSEVRDKVKGLDKFYEELRQMPRPPVLFHDYNAHRYDRVQGGPDDPSAKFKKSFDAYAKYVKQQRDARREEYNEQQRLMLEKRKKMLMARRMSELADEQHRLLTGQFTPGSRPGYVHDPYAALRWRPRRRDPQYYRRRPMEYDVSDGTNALYPDVDDDANDEADDGNEAGPVRKRKRMSRRVSRRSSSSSLDGDFGPTGRGRK